MTGDAPSHWHESDSNSGQNGKQEAGSCAGYAVMRASGALLGGSYEPSLLRTTFQDVSYNVPCCRVSVSTSIVRVRGKTPRTTLAGR